MLLVCYLNLQQPYLETEMSGDERRAYGHALERYVELAYMSVSRTAMATKPKRETARSRKMR